MKKNIFLIPLFTLASLSISNFKEPLNLMAASEVDTTSINASDLVGGYDITTSIVDTGIKAIIPGANTAGNNAWQKQLLIPNNPSKYDCFSIKNGNKISFEFSANLFDASGSVISQSVNSGGAFDIYMFDASTNNQLAIVRLFTSSGAPLNGDHSYELYYGSGWGNKVSGSSWIKGDATASSSFFLQFDIENMFQSYTSAGEGLSTLDDENGNYLSKAKDTFVGVDNVYFKIMGNNGFTNETEVVIKSINGQSLANENGKFYDDVAPTFKDATVSETIPVGQEYEIMTTASDLLGNVTYSLLIGEEEIDGKKFTPTTDGELKVTLKAKDGANNVSTKEYTFQVVSNIAKPEISDVAVIYGGAIDLFAKLKYPLPTYTDETGSATVELKVYKDEELVTTLTPNASNEFEMFVPSTFEDGDYVLVYEVTNSAGTTRSENIEVNYHLRKGAEASFATPLDENIAVDYVDEGLRIRSSKSYVETNLGLFDVSNGFDIKYLINEKNTNKAYNDTSYFNLIFSNANDENYRAVYRVWSNYSGADCATNVYISTDGWNTFKDITDTGWISRTVDGVNGKYHMGFNMDETFIGERTGGIQKVDNASADLEAFFAACPSSFFNVRVETSKLDAPSLTNNYEVIITEINGQSLANTNGVINNVNDATLIVKGLKDVVQLNDVANIEAYAKDIFMNINTKMKVVDPSGATRDLEIENGNPSSFTFEALGEYTFEFTTKGSNDKDVKVEKKVNVKSSTADITIALDGNYNSQYAVNDSITILNTLTSDNVVNQVVKVSGAGMNNEVKIGDTYQFITSGIYTITYEAFDDAKPTPNSKTITITINVPDTTNPMIILDVLPQILLNQEVTPRIEVFEDSEYDIKVTLESSNEKVNLKSSNNYAFTLTKEGTYKLVVSVEDIYGNKTTIEKEIKTIETSNNKKGCKNATIPSTIGLLTLVGALLISKKRK